MGVEKPKRFEVAGGKACTVRAPGHLARLKVRSEPSFDAVRFTGASLYDAKDPVPGGDGQKIALGVQRKCVDIEIGKAKVVFGIVPWIPDL